MKDEKGSETTKKEVRRRKKTERAKRKKREKEREEIQKRKGENEKGSETMKRGQEKKVWMQNGDPRMMRRNSLILDSSCARKLSKRFQRRSTPRVVELVVELQVMGISPIKMSWI